MIWRSGASTSEPSSPTLAHIRGLVHEVAMNVASPAARNNWPDLIRPAMRDVATSGIVEVFNYGRGRQGLIPLWVGEGDLPTPPFISEAAKASLDRGETFLHLAERGAGAARSDRGLHDASLRRSPGRRRFLTREFLCDDRRHARDRDRDPAHCRPGRRGADPHARLAQFRRRARDFRGARRARPARQRGPLEP